MVIKFFDSWYQISRRNLLPKDFQVIIDTFFFFFSPHHVDKFKSNVHCQIFFTLIGTKSVQSSDYNFDQAISHVNRSSQNA